VDLNKIIDVIHAKHIRITDHAGEEAQSDKLKCDEIYGSVLQGEVKEDCPKDKPYPSSLFMVKQSLVNQFFLSELRMKCRSIRV